MQPIVSIICPIRNEENYISLCIDSILEQTIQQDRIEIIVVDGMSIDRTRSILKSYCMRLANIKLFDNEKLRVTTGFNIGLINARGDIIIRVDGHAKLASLYIEKCISYLKKTGADCVGGVIESINNTKSGKAIALAMSSKFGVGNSYFRTSQKEGYVDTVAFGAYKRDVFNRIGILDEELIGADDDEFNYRLRHSGGRIYMTPEIRASYYTRSDFKKLWHQYFGYGFWKVRVMQKHFKMMQPRQFIPALFILFLICTSIGTIYSYISLYLFLLILFCYLATSLIAVIMLALKNSSGLLIRIFFSFIILHFSYGTGFLWGQIKFFPRWFGKI
jgi:glycosyltransferase involved in cell wall biosynthesis